MNDLMMKWEECALSWKNPMKDISIFPQDK